VQFRPRGDSMTGKIDSGQLVTVAPLGERAPKPGDIVLCKVNGTQYLHLVKAVPGSVFRSATTEEKINGWTSKRSIFGIVTAVAS
jgi:SOS-response transcriptional repressor LexA